MRFTVIIASLMTVVAMAESIERPVAIPFSSGQIHNEPWLSKILNKTAEIKHSMVALTADFKERVRELALASCEPPFIDSEYEAAQKPTCYKKLYAEIHLRITEDSKVNPLNATVASSHLRKGL